MDAITYRIATREDLPVLLGFEQGIIEFERPFDSNLKNPTTYYNFNTLFDSPDAEIIVACHNQTIIGSGYAKIAKAAHYHKNEVYTYMGFMYINPEYRNQGIIQNIITELKIWSKNRGVLETRLLVYSDNIGAIKAYKKNGFKPHMLEMKQYL